MVARADEGGRDRWPSPSATTSPWSCSDRCRTSTSRGTRSRRRACPGRRRTRCRWPPSRSWRRSTWSCRACSATSRVPTSSALLAIAAVRLRRRPAGAAHRRRLRRLPRACAVLRRPRAARRRSRRRSPTMTPTCMRPGTDAAMRAAEGEPSRVQAVRTAVSAMLRGAARTRSAAAHVGLPVGAAGVHRTVRASRRRRGAAARAPPACAPGADRRAGRDAARLPRPRRSRAAVPRRRRHRPALDRVADVRAACRPRGCARARRRERALRRCRRHVARRPARGRVARVARARHVLPGRPADRPRVAERAAQAAGRASDVRRPAGGCAQPGRGVDGLARGRRR